jgi:hypothetical protein
MVNNSPEIIKSMKPAFKEIAKNTIIRAFRSAVCIDDDYASAYSEIQGLNNDDPRILYNSFREEAFCDLDIHHFSSLEDTWKDHMLENKELMILDWELDKVGELYKSTLEILNYVVQSKKIPFVLIYTNTQDLNSVGKNIIEQLNPLNQKQYDSFIENFNKLQHICEEEVDFDTIKDSAKEMCFSYINNYTKREQLKKELIQLINEKIPVKKEHREKLIPKIITMLEPLINVKGEDEILYFSFLVLREANSKVSHSLKRIETKDNAYLLNNAVTILIFHKESMGGIAPNSLFDAFSNAIINNPHNFLSLLALEFKDTLKENFNNIGIKFSSLNEDAFFYHMKNYKQDEVFKIDEIYDFILKGWISELYQQKIAEKSNVLNYLPERYAELHIDTKVKSPELISNLLKYSAYISTINLYSENKRLWFGDVFKNKNSDYFLCITPHCDCVRPEEKIKNNFYFIKGYVYSEVDEALIKAETDFLSFILEDNKPLCIKWRCKPFTSFIDEPNIETLKLSYAGKESELLYVISLKENYAQRISNESFSYGYRVGIDLPHFASIST